MGLKILQKQLLKATSKFCFQECDPFWSERVTMEKKGGL